MYPSKVLYTLDTQIARYLDGDLGVYRPAIGPGWNTIQDLLTHKVIDTHVSNLIELRSDSSEALSPLEAAACNAVEFFVERISNHKGLTSRKTEMEFLVSWKGFSSEADS